MIEKETSRPINSDVRGSVYLTKGEVPEQGKQPLKETEDVTG